MARAFGLDAGHARVDELQSFVEGRSFGRRAEWLEGHINGCEWCAAALRREARVQLAVESAFGGSTLRASPAGSNASAMGGAALALAASLLLLVHPGALRSPRFSGTPSGGFELSSRGPSARPVVDLDAGEHTLAMNGDALSDAGPSSLDSLRLTSPAD